MLQGKIALVTGAGRGIGRAVALTLAQYGADVAVNYSGSRECAEQTAEEIRSLGRRAVVVQADISSEEDCERMFREVEAALGTLDILVNNAGSMRDSRTMHRSETEFEEGAGRPGDVRLAPTEAERRVAIEDSEYLLYQAGDTNLKGAFLCMKLAGKAMMRKRYGRIINIPPGSGIRSNAGQIDYCAAKAGLLGMTKCLAKALAGRNVTVNAVAPGYIDTEMTADLSDKVKNEALAQVPLGRMGEPWDIAEAVAFLASDRAPYITGQTLQVNGGMGI